MGHLERDHKLKLDVARDYDKAGGFQRDKVEDANVCELLTGKLQFRGE